MYLNPSIYWCDGNIMDFLSLPYPSNPFVKRGNKSFGSLQNIWQIIFSTSFEISRTFNITYNASVITEEFFLTLHWLVHSSNVVTIRRRLIITRNNCHDLPQRHFSVTSTDDCTGAISNGLLTKYVRRIIISLSMATIHTFPHDEI